MSGGPARAGIPNLAARTGTREPQVPRLHGRGPSVEAPVPLDADPWEGPSSLVAPPAAPWGSAPPAVTSAGSSGRSHGASAALPAPAPLAPCLADLPAALLHEIFHQLDAPDLGRVSCCCRLFSRLAAESPGWQRFYCDRWHPPLAYAQPVAPVVSSPALFRPIVVPSPSPTLAPSPKAALGAQSTAPDAGNGGVGQLATGPDKRQQAQGLSPELWRQLYLQKERRSAALLGRYEADWMTGHTAGVRCVAVLPQAPIAVSAGYDSVVRIWDLDRALPVAASAPVGETLRAIAAGKDYLAMGGTGCAVRLWYASLKCPYLYDVDGMWTLGGSRPRAKGARGGTGPPDTEGTAGSSDMEDDCGPVLLHGHSGPISCLAARSSTAGGPPRLFSGSWDHNVICWNVDRGVVYQSAKHRRRMRQSTREDDTSSAESLDLLGTPMLLKYSHRDWVYSVVARRGHVYSTAGSAQYSWDAETGTLLRMRPGVHEGKANAVEASVSGHYVLTAGNDGFVRMFDERVKGKGKESSKDDAVTYWLAHNAPVNSLALEDPWLVTAAGDGCCAVLDVGQVMHAGRSAAGRGRRRAMPVPGLGKATFEPLRRLGGGHGPALSVAMGHERVVCGSSDSSVRVFDFRGAAEMQTQPKKAAKKKLRAKNGDGFNALAAHS